MDQAQISVASGLDDCRVCMQKRKSLDADFFDSRAAEESSRKLWIMIEFSNSVQVTQESSQLSKLYPTF